MVDKYSNLGYADAWCAICADFPGLIPAAQGICDACDAGKISLDQCYAGLDKLMAGYNAPKGVFAYLPLPKKGDEPAYVLDLSEENLSKTHVKTIEGGIETWTPKVV
jgi:hypothetical protein